MRRRRASLHITLVLIGAAGLSACGRAPEPQLRRPIYASLEDCKADWDAPQACESFTDPGTSPGSTGGSGARPSGTHYYGPYYWSGGSSSGTWERPHPNSRAIGATSPTRPGTGSHSSTVSRSGFGSTSASHASSSG